MGIEKEWDIRIGRMKKGPKNKITDVPGVTVGHCTLAQGDVQTGVTALLPHGGDLFHDKVMAASYVINGFGKSAGLVEIDEMGFLETPILLTNTLSVGTASEALVRYMLERNPDIGETTGTVNPVVCECNDGQLNDIRGLHVREEHVRAALSSCGEDFPEGAVGAGRGMKCHGLKGGIGSASRRFKLGGETYTLGALVLTNHGSWRDLLVGGEPVGEKIPYPKAPEPEKGSIITVLATDVPLSERQLKRVCRRVPVGISRCGGYCGNGSGEIALAFTTANRIPHYPETAVLPLRMLRDDDIDTVFHAAAEAVEEAILSSMLHAEPVTGKHGYHLSSLADILRENRKNKGGV